MNLGLCVIAYNRPHYLKATLESVARMPEVDSKSAPVRVYCDKSDTMLQNSDIAKSFGFNVTLRKERMGNGINVISSIDDMFTEFDYVAMLDDDIVVSKHWLTVMKRLMQQCENVWTNIGLVNSPVTDLGAKEPDDINAVFPGWEHICNRLMSRKCWKSIYPYLRSYIDQCLAGIEYKDRDNKVIWDLHQYYASTASADLNRYGDIRNTMRVRNILDFIASGNKVATGQDGMTRIAMAYTGWFTMNTLLPRCVHIGKEGQHTTPEAWEKRYNVVLTEYPEDVFFEMELANELTRENQKEANEKR